MAFGFKGGGCAKARSNRRMEACPIMLTYAQSTLRLWAGHSTIAQHFYPPVATALEKTPFGFKLGVYKLGRDCFLMFGALIASVLKKLGETNRGDVRDNVVRF